MLQIQYKYTVSVNCSYPESHLQVSCRGDTRGSSCLGPTTRGFKVSRTPNLVAYTTIG